MPASNELINWAYIRSVIDTAYAVSGAYWLWDSSDPGTGTLPDNKIGDNSTFQSNINYTPAGASTLCPDYSTLSSGLIAPAIDILSLAGSAETGLITFSLTSTNYPSGAGVSYNVFINTVYSYSSTTTPDGSPSDSASLTAGDVIDVYVFLKTSGGVWLAGNNTSTTVP